MDDTSFDSAEIYKNDQKELEKILEEIYQYLYYLIKKDIKEYIDNNKT